MVKLFNDVTIDTAFRGVFNKIDAQLRNLPDTTFLSTTVEVLAKRVSEMYKLKGIFIDWSSIKPAIEMRQVSGRSFPPDYDVDRNKNYPCAYVSYTVPIKGDITLLSTRPSKRMMTVDVNILVNGNTFSFGYQTRYSNTDLSDAVKKAVKEYLDSIRQTAPEVETAINEEVAEFNSSTINAYASEEIAKRILAIKKHNDNLNDLI
jgi:hypothetical protein